MHLNEVNAGERALLFSISAGSERAFKSVFDEYGPKVFRYALKLCKSKELAEDVVHDVFLKIWVHKNLQEIENLESYLKISARNQILKVLKKEQQIARFKMDMKPEWSEIHNDTEELIGLKDAESAVKEAVEKLPPQQQLVFKLCHIEGLKYREAAERLTLSPLTVKTHMQLALRFLRNHIQSKENTTLYLAFLLILEEIR